MGTLVLVVVLIPLVAALTGLAIYLSMRVADGVRHWRDRRSTYIPTRVWWDDRYGGTDGDPTRYRTDQERRHGGPTWYGPGA